MSKYCSNCNKKFEDYLKYCPDCMENLEFIYDRQDILDSYQKELDNILESLNSMDEKIASLREKLDMIHNYDAEVDLKFKITILTEKKIPLENEFNTIQKKIDEEEKIKKNILKDVASKENLYMKLFIELDGDKLESIKNNNQFKNKTKEEIIVYLMNNYDENKINEILDNLNFSVKNSELLYEELYISVNDDILRGLCDYFSIILTTKEEVLNHLIRTYSKNSIYGAINSVKEDIALEDERKEFYDRLMSTFTSTDVSLFCRKFDIDNPSKHRVIDYLVENFDEDEIDSMKLELYHQYEQTQQKENLIKQFNSTLTSSDIEMLANEFNLNNNREEVINFLVDNFTPREINLKLNDLLLTQLKSLNIYENSKKQAISLYNKGKNGDSNYQDFYNNVNKILKFELSCFSTPNLDVRMKKVLLQFEFNKDIEIVSNFSGISKDTIRDWFLKGQSGNLVFKDFYQELKQIYPSFNPVNKTKTNNVKKQSKKQSKNPDDDELFMMDGVLEALKFGKTRFEAAELADINVSQISSWISQGKAKKSRNTIYFYNEIKKIESGSKKNIKNTKTISNENKKIKGSSKNILNTKKSSNTRKIEVNTENNPNLNKKNVNKIIKLMKKGMSRYSAGKEVGVSANEIDNWYNLGKNRHDDLTIYFYKNVVSIVNKKHNLSKIIQKATNNSKAGNASKNQDKKIVCPHCGRKISKSSGKCPYCFSKFDKKSNITSCEISQMNSGKWKYSYKLNGKYKVIIGDDLEDLKQKVKSKKLPWNC